MRKPEAGGLFAGGQRVPLRGVSIDVKASGVAAQVTVAQRYHNLETVPVAYREYLRRYFNSIRPQETAPESEDE